MISLFCRPEHLIDRLISSIMRWSLNCLLVLTFMALILLVLNVVKYFFSLSMFVALSVFRSVFYEVIIGSNYSFQLIVFCCQNYSTGNFYFFATIIGVTRLNRAMLKTIQKVQITFAICPHLWFFWCFDNYLICWRDQLVFLFNLLKLIYCFLLSFPEDIFL